MYNSSEITRNRLCTERKLVDAVGAVIKNHGYEKLGVNAIAREADVSKSLLYRYFGNVDHCIETYLLEKNFWMPLRGVDAKLASVEENEKVLKEAFLEMLHLQFLMYFHDEELQAIARWQMDQKNRLLNSVKNVMEIRSSHFFDSADQFFKDSKVNFRVVSAILSSAVCYLASCAKVSGHPIGGLSLDTSQGRNEVINTLNQIVDMIFSLCSPRKKAVEPIA